MELMLFAIGVGILCYLAFIYLFPKALPEDESQHTRNALDRIYQDNKALNAGSNPELESILKQDFEDAAPFVRTFFSLPGMKEVYITALQAGFLQSMNKIPVYIIVIFILLSYVLTGIVGIAGIILAAILAYLLPLKYFRKKIRKRNQQFIDMFPDVLDMIVRSVRSGFPLNTALQIVAENMEDPVKQEFKQVADEVALGRSLHEALSRMGQRINEPDIQFFIVVLRVQQETGGNLAEVISNLSNVIRKRKQLRLKIKAMTSEGRATAWVLGSLPVFVFGVLFVIRREYLSILWTDPGGQMLFGLSIALIALAVFIVNQMIDIDI